MTKIDDNVKQVAVSMHDVVYIKDNGEMWGLGEDYSDVIGIKGNAGRFEHAQKSRRKCRIYIHNDYEVYAILNNGELYRRRGTITKMNLMMRRWINGAEKY